MYNLCPEGSKMKPATTITKVCRVLEEFRSRPSMGVSDLARRTDLLPSDVHRILTSLQYCGYIDQDPETKRHRLGCGLLKLGLIAGQRMRLREASRPLLQRLSEELDATALLAMFDGHELEVFLVEQIDCPVETFLSPASARLWGHTVLRSGKPSWRAWTVRLPCER
jgi:IclR family acetate operon transcriptional repressor